MRPGPLLESASALGYVCALVFGGLFVNPRGDVATIAKYGSFLFYGYESQLTAEVLLRDGSRRGAPPEHPPAPPCRLAPRALAVLFEFLTTPKRLFSCVPKLKMVFDHFLIQ